MTKSQILKLKKNTIVKLHKSFERWNFDQAEESTTLNGKTYLVAYLEMKIIGLGLYKAKFIRYNPKTNYVTIKFIFNDKRIPSNYWAVDPKSIKWSAE